jgi:hypothetical protein
MEPAPAGRDRSLSDRSAGSAGESENGLAWKTLGERPHRRLALLLQLTDVAIKNSADVHAWNPYMRMIREGRPRIPLNQVNLVQGAVHISGSVSAVGWEEVEAGGASLRSIVDAIDPEARQLLDELFADIVPGSLTGEGSAEPWGRKRDLMLRAVGFLIFRAPYPLT